MAKLTKEVRDGVVRWEARVSWMEGGKQRHLSRRFPTKAEAQVWRTQMEAERNRSGRLVRSSALTLNAHLDQWLATLHDLSARTRVDYENVTRRYWRPTLGEERLDRLTTPAIRTVLADMSEAGLSPTTLRQAHAVLRIALGAAVDDGLLPQNPALGKRMLPARERREQRVLNGAEVTRLLRETASDPLGALWAVALTTGMRPGELLGLQWPDVSLERRELSVQRTLVRPTNGARWLLEEPKTERSRRAIPLIEATATALQRHRDRQAVDRLTAGARYATHDFVFADEWGEPLRADGVYKYSWLPTLRRLGLPRVRLYDCRHSAATMWLEAGLSMRLVMELLGHASMALTSDTYSHVTPGYRRTAADALTTYLADQPQHAG